MKIAIPSLDGKTIFPHFGRSRSFMIVSIDGDRVSKEMISNNFTGHAQGGHHENHDHQHDHQHGHSHENIRQALDVCDIVIAGGMGPRLLNDFTNWGKKVFLTREQNIDRVIQSFMNDELEHDPQVSCKN